MQVNRANIQWIIVNAIGLATGFWLILQVSTLIEFRQLEWVPESPGDGIDAYMARLISTLVGGAILGFAQFSVTKGLRVAAFPWVALTASGFAATILIVWPLIFFGLWGEIPGPAEPIIILVGGGSLAAIAQFFYLRRRKVDAARWLVAWIGGLILSLIPAALFFGMFADYFDLSLSWPVEVFISGLIVGGFAAWLSAGEISAMIVRQQTGN